MPHPIPSVDRTCGSGGGAHHPTRSCISRRSSHDHPPREWWWWEFSSARENLRSPVVGASASRRSRTRSMAVGFGSGSDARAGSVSVRGVSVVRWVDRLCRCVLLARVSLCNIRIRTHRDRVGVLVLAVRDSRETVCHYQKTAGERFSVRL